VVGAAIVEACQDARQQLFAIAADQLDACHSRIKGRGRPSPRISGAPPPKLSPPAAVRRSPQYYRALQSRRRRASSGKERE
jgi:hypothetical protein